MTTRSEPSGIAVPSYSGKGKLWLGLLGALIVAGLAAWAYQLTTGLVTTGMRNVFSSARWKRNCDPSRA